jgi:formylglycine-generating enzyme required for sulfatase activity
MWVLVGVSALSLTNCFDWRPQYAGYYRVLRGGSWDYGPTSCRVGDLCYMIPMDGEIIGFRTVLSKKQQ